MDIDHLVEEIVKELTNKHAMKNSNDKYLVPIGVSGRHCHLTKSDFEKLFGSEASLTKKADLSQPGQFAANETVTIAGPKGSIQNVRILGPLRRKTQVEISLTDARKLGVTPPIRESGELMDSSPVTIIGPKGSIYLKEGLIIAQAHIHMNPEDAVRFNVKDGEFVRVKIINESRPISFEKVKVRVSPNFVLEMHIDTDEANAADVKPGTFGKLFKLGGPI
ncbi:phosphate propanoyltransferase [Bacillus sp. P2(2020)]|uniref:Phosphate propanoyltransferase n=2 Tax=Calidifontibacillus erzurumensis TaxID=2741433 RepID=A0A8J8GEQ5_9BACI|nr:phosphate propanoyltransferase [Calidifontibacillus erzurumensis]NSL51048.1 phosphate propanoyltransferase [Calidifontibacillus erzurumensis]